MGGSGQSDLNDYGWSRPSIKDGPGYSQSQTLVSRSMTDKINMLADGQDSQDEIIDEELENDAVE